MPQVSRHRVSLERTVSVTHKDQHLLCSLSKVEQHLNLEEKLWDIRRRQLVQPSISRSQFRKITPLILMTMMKDQELHK